MLGGQRSHVIIERAEEGEPGDEASLWPQGRFLPPRVYRHVILKPRPSPFIAEFAHTQLHSARARAIITGKAWVLRLNTLLQKAIKVLHNSTMRMSPDSLLFRERLASETTCVQPIPSVMAGPSRIVTAPLLCSRTRLSCQFITRVGAWSIARNSRGCARAPVRFPEVVAHWVRSLHMIRVYASTDALIMGHMRQCNPKVVYKSYVSTNFVYITYSLKGTEINNKHVCKQQQIASGNFLVKTFIL